MAFVKADRQDLLVAHDHAASAVFAGQSLDGLIPGYVVAADARGFTNGDDVQPPDWPERRHVAVASSVFGLMLGHSSSVKSVNNPQFVRRNRLQIANRRYQFHFDPSYAYMKPVSYDIGVAVNTVETGEARVLLATLQTEYLKSLIANTKRQLEQTKQPPASNQDNGLHTRLQMIEDHFNKTGEVDDEVLEPLVYAGRIGIADSIIFRSVDIRTHRPALHDFETTRSPRTFRRTEIKM